MAGAGVLYFINYGPKSKQPGAFQPGSEILNKALDPKSVVPGSLPYPFEKNVCSGSTTYECLKEYYQKVSKDHGTVAAATDIKKRSQEDVVALAQCHQLMHVIGRAAADAFDSISEAFAQGDSFCWSGYHHGVMEAMVAKTPSQELHVEIDKICADIPGKESYNFDYFNCVHGLGHGVYAYYEGEIFPALKMCDNLSGHWERESCYSGVFMQNIIDSTFTQGTGHEAKYLRPGEPLYPCTAVEEKYKGQCYLGQTSYALQVNGFNWQEVFGLCATVAQPYRDICNQSMGRDVANQAGHEKNKTKELCALATTTNDRVNCIIGAVKEIISYYHDDREAYEFCDILSGEDKKICSATVKEYYSYF